MSHRNFKIAIVGGEAEINETIIVSHYIDLVYPCFVKLTEKLVARYPAMATLPYKITWQGESSYIS